MLTEFITDPDGADQDHDPGGTDSDQDHLAKENAKARQGQCAHICSSHFAVSLQFFASLHNCLTLVQFITQLNLFAFGFLFVNRQRKKDIAG